MNQLYAETAVKRKSDAKSTTLRTLMIIGVVIGAFLVMMGSYLSIAGIVIIAAIIYLFPNLNVEYEYVFVDGQIDFDRITGKSKRRTVLRVDMEQVEIIAPSGSHALDGYMNTQSEKRDFSSGDRNIKPYIIVANLEDKKYLIAFEPSEKMLTMIKQKSPRKLAQY